MGIRKFKSEEWYKIIQLWNRTLSGDPITENIFLKWLMMDPNYDHEGFRVVEIDGKIKAAGIGWCRIVNNKEEDNDKGFLFPLLIDDSSERIKYGQALLNDMDNYFKKRGKKTIHIRGCNSLFPDAVDSDKSPIYIQNAYSDAGKVYSMRVDLYKFRIAEDIQERITAMGKEGFTFTHYTANDMSEIQRFFLDENSTNWLLLFWEKICMGAPAHEFIFIKKENQIVGYCQHNHYCQQPERVGLFLIAKSMRKQKIGQALVAKLLESMSYKGFQTAYFNSCSEENSHFYAKNGFKIFREKTYLKKEL